MAVPYIVNCMFCAGDDKAYALFLFIIILPKQDLLMQSYIYGTSVHINGSFCVSQTIMINCEH